MYVKLENNSTQTIDKDLLICYSKIVMSDITPDRTRGLQAPDRVDPVAVDQKTAQDLAELRESFGTLPRYAKRLGVAILVLCGTAMAAGYVHQTIVDGYENERWISIDTDK